MRDRIVVQDVEISENEFSAGLNLGGHGAPGGEGEIQKIPAEGGESENTDTQKDNTESMDVSVEKYDSADEIPEEMWELKPSRINRQEVYIGRSEVSEKCFIKSCSVSEQGGQYANLIRGKSL